jgi:hypothetical protein
MADINSGIVSANSGVRRQGHQNCERDAREEDRVRTSAGPGCNAQNIGEDVFWSRHRGTRGFTLETAQATNVAMNRPRSFHRERSPESSDRCRRDERRNGSGCKPGTTDSIHETEADAK